MLSKNLFYILCLLLFVSCIKRSSESKSEAKEIKVIIRNFDTGINTVEYTDGTKTTSKFSIENSVNRKPKKIKTDVLDPEEEEIILEDRKDGYYYDPDTGDEVSGTAYGVFDTEAVVTAVYEAHFITGLLYPFVRIKNPISYFNSGGRNVTRNATIMGLIFTHNPLPTPIAYCEWSYYINCTYTYSPYAPPKTRQYSYIDQKIIVAK